MRFILIYANVPIVWLIVYWFINVTDFRKFWAHMLFIHLISLPALTLFFKFPRRSRFSDWFPGKHPTNWYRCKYSKIIIISPLAVDYIMHLPHSHFFLILNFKFCKHKCSLENLNQLSKSFVNVYVKFVLITTIIYFLIPKVY